MSSQGSSLSASCGVTEMTVKVRTSPPDLMRSTTCLWVAPSTLTLFLQQNRNNVYHSFPPLSPVSPRSYNFAKLQRATPTWIATAAARRNSIGRDSRSTRIAARSCNKLTCFALYRSDSRLISRTDGDYLPEVTRSLFRDVSARHESEFARESSARWVSRKSLSFRSGPRPIFRDERNR